MLKWNTHYIGYESENAGAPQGTPRGGAWAMCVQSAIQSCCTIGNAGSATAFDANHCMAINGVAGTQAISTSSYNASYAINISCVKVNCATSADYLQGTGLISASIIVTSQGQGGSVDVRNIAVGTATNANKLLLNGAYCSAQSTVGTNIIVGTNASGIISAYGFNVPSKRCAKENIIPLDVPALDLVNSVCVVSYNYKCQNVPKIGFIAEDTRSEFSTPNRDTMDLASSIGILLKSVQEISQRLNILENT
jgi:hypothetical protein